ncbi:MAG TPA: hypothetical protein VFT43_05365 [Candidatus Polarisedimenticolia bacterium]|nr:hypothetical protein [Candidatus Polarisedimenticolia bacterium]
MSKTTWATVLFLGIFGMVVIYLSLAIPQYECEVCVTFGSGAVCRTAASGSEKESVESAQTSACGTLAAGMTESIRCQNTRPDSVTCRRK